MKENIKCIIVDDDSCAAEILADYIQELPGLELLRIYHSSVAALAEIPREKSTCLIFMDIDMPYYSGMQLAEKIKPLGHHLIFTTAHAQYALKAFEVNARHYLLKPIELGRFAEVVSEILAVSAPVEGPEKDSDLIFLKTGEHGTLTGVRRSQIIYIQGSLNYVDVFLINEKYCTYMTMKEMERLFSAEYGFYRVHRSYIINKEYVSRITGNIISLSGHKVTMSGDYKTEFVKYLSKNTLVSGRLRGA
ncbi:MAG: LytTR family DNA-binding domain-containing protein [Bacteroidota bacterium]